ncbi:MAG: 50S ribosomal protein L11 methyltransferase [Solirubrobacteraceae bacterium]
MLRLALRVHREDAELVLAELLELAPGGVEEVELGDEMIEYAVYGAPGEIPALPDLEAAAGGALVQIATTEVADDWADRWRAFHQPLILTGHLSVRPPWEPPSNEPLDIVIDPGQAFGTGAHATTRLCLELMLELQERTGPFVDLGCGSGVLAIAAARLGFSPVTGLDYDPLSVECTRRNAAVNRVQVSVVRHDLRAAPVPGTGGATVAANLLAGLLRAWIVQLERSGELPRAVVASGLLTHESEHVAEGFKALGLREVARRERGEWAALLLLARASPATASRG